MINPNRLSDSDIKILGAYAHYAGLEEKDEIDEEILVHLRKIWDLVLERDDRRKDSWRGKYGDKND